MKMFTVLLCVLCVSMVSLSAFAADRGPQKQTTSVTTNAAPAAIALPIGDTGRFDPAWLVLAGSFGGTTQTLSYVSGTYTGTVSAAVTAAGIMALTNIPTQFSGDKFLLTTTGLTTNAISATIIGRVFD